MKVWSSLVWLLSEPDKIPVTFKANFSEKTVNKTFQLSPISCHKELHLRCCRALELNILRRSMQIFKNTRGHLPWSSATLEKHENLTILHALKIHFQRFFELSFLHLISNGLKRKISTHWCRLWFCYTFLCSIFSKGTQTFNFIRPNIILKLTCKVNTLIKFMEIWSCFSEIQQ